VGKNRRKNREEREKRFKLPNEIKQIIWGVLMLLVSVLIVLSFFGYAGKAGQLFIKSANLAIGNTVFVSPLILFLGGVALLFSNKGKEEGFFRKTFETFWPVVFAIILLFIGVTGILGSLGEAEKRGGWLGVFISWPFINFFGLIATQIIFLAVIAIGGIIFWKFLVPRGTKKSAIKEEADKKPTSIDEVSVGGEESKRESFIKSFFTPKFKVKEITSFPDNEAKPVEIKQKSEVKPVLEGKVFPYQPPPIDLLSPEKGAPTSVDIKVNSAVIKKTLQNFGIDVTMSEINIGPTVTQFTLKPAEGIKLSKITGLSNDLALSLAAHPIRIEAPVPGKSLVGIEVPNKGRAEVRLRNLIENESFQNSPMNMILALGRDVAGFPVYADLTRMPHLLVAGATGTGKTIFLNSLIASLLYQPSTPTKSAGPETLRLVMVDPKRVEFPVYNKLPHLLCPVIYNANQTVNALKWLTCEMERRFDVLAEARARDIKSFNEKALKEGTDVLPFIIVIIDELADLMMARGRDIEAGIVRLAQMARAVGIHLVVATQRPSVEVITGLIKANITSRITFQVASQIDSRTVIDTSGAEKLLGLGDMLYISASNPKPKRIQGAYVSDKEMRKVVSHIESQSENLGVEMNENLLQELNKNEGSEQGAVSFYGGEGENVDDSLYEEAKRMVIECKKASSSLLQRRLRVGYARAARLIDMLEEKGIVGPQEGSKPREIYGATQMNLQGGEIPVPPEKKITEDGWEKV
jgi:DNA segregation ATPase FtsK/SpoIIIE, S-DNA-T family